MAEQPTGSARGAAAGSGRGRDIRLLEDGGAAQAERQDDTVPGALGPTQLEGEHLQNDPEWQGGCCWLASYMKMHQRLIQKARVINSDRDQERASTQAAAGQEDVSIVSSMQLLRREVITLCPLHFLLSGMGMSFALTVMSFCVPYVQGQLLDATIDAMTRKRSGEAVDEFEVIFPKLLLVALLMFGSYLCEVVVGILFAISGHVTVTRLRIKLFRNLTVQDISFYDAHVSGELSSRLINDSASLSSLTQFATQNMMGSIVKFSGSLVAMYATHPLLALIATVISPINTILVMRTGKTVGHYGTVQNHAMAKANAVAIEVLGSIRTVQSNVGETEEAVRFMERMNYFLRVIKGTVYLETVLRFTQFGLSRVRDVVVLAVAMHQVITGSLTIGQYTAFAQYIALYEDGFKCLADIWLNFKQVITSTGKFVQLLLRRPEISPDVEGIVPSVCVGEIKFDRVKFAYQARPEQTVLAELSLRAAPGDVVALVGESGAGKSTVGRLLQRYYDPTAGSIYLDGVDFRELKLWWLRAQIGVVEQEPVLFDRPISENIAYGSARISTQSKVEQASRLANAHDFIENLQEGYKTHPGEKAARLSGGQKQRVAIARAIVREPKVLLLDEATSALDSENEHLVQQAIDDVMRARQATTFVIAHRLSTVKNATRILVLHNGKVVEQGSHEELLRLQGGKYASFMQHQLVEKNPLLS